MGHPLCRLLVGFEHLFQTLDKAGRQLGGAAYEILALWASRRSEFRADAFAASQEGTEPGIALFRSLAAATMFEPSQRPISLHTHPTHRERVKALKRFNSKPHNIN
ncbi:MULTISPECIES: M48 family metalloprotease [Halomonas]|uniref:M48 family metalloprotease n=1 Tax=Halomonas TaxID=2745 RepID=UPI0018691487